MIEQDDELMIRRILIALDASRHSLAALQAAARLASSMDAELHGLFVEDINLLRAARLPMARELPFPFAGHAPMSPERMGRQLRAQASRARRSLASISRRQQIEWTFQVLRGHVSPTVLEEATKADLLCLGRMSRPVMQRPGLGSTARAAATQAHCCVLLVSHGSRIHPPVAVSYDGSSKAEQALMLASRLTRELGGFLSILVPADAPRSSEELRQQIAERLEGHNLMIRYRALVGVGLTPLISAVEGERCGVLVLSRGVLSPSDIDELVDAVECPVLLVR